MKENKIGNAWHTFIKSIFHLSSIFYWKITLKITSHLIKKEGGGKVAQ